MGKETLASVEMFGVKILFCSLCNQEFGEFDSHQELEQGKQKHTTETGHPAQVLFPRPFPMTGIV